MAKPKLNRITKHITTHPAVKDLVFEFARTESEKMDKKESVKVKNIAVITNVAMEFRIYKLHNERTDNHHNFVHISRLNELEGIEWSDYVKLANQFKMPEVNKIVAEVIKMIK